MQQVTPRLILASGSPRRQQLLADAGVAFEVNVVAVDEDEVRAPSPEQLVTARARLKAEATAATIKEGFVLGADTVIVLDGEVLGKPRDEEDARRMLSRLSDRAHAVMTGVAICPVGAAIERLEVSNIKSEDVRSGRMHWEQGALLGCGVTEVTMGPLSPDVIAAYVATGEPLDKAGAYGIQGIGGLLVQSIAGEYFNVVGLPLALLRDMLGVFGVELLS